MKTLTYRNLKNIGILNLMSNKFNLYIETKYGDNIIATYNATRNVYELKDSTEILTHNELMDCSVTAITGDINGNVPAIYVVPTVDWLNKHFLE